jgi:hypothetical protein
MSYPYFGVVESVFGDPGHARIRVLAKMSRGGDQRDQSFSPEDLGLTRKVFLTGGANEIGLATGNAVRFDATENPKEPRPGRDDDRFMVEIRNHRFCISIDTAALAVVEVERVDTSASRLREVDPLLAGRRVYVHWADRFEGPWQVEDDGSNLRPVRGGIYKSKRVFSFPLESSDSAIYVNDWDPRSVRGYFLLEIDPHHGTPLDLATGKQLAGWLLKLATRDEDLSRVLKDLDQGSPGWRKRLREAFDELEDDIDRAVYRDRLKRIEKIIETLELNGGALRELGKSRAFLGLWNIAVEERRKELEEQARKAFEVDRTRLEKERADLEASVTALRSKHDAFIEEREQADAKIHRLLEHLKAEHERLVRDVALIHDILPSGSSLGRLENPTAPPTTINELLAIQPGSKAGTAVTPTSSRAFSEGSLASALAYHGLETDGSKLLHAAMLACRSLLLPGPSWSRAYASALGPTSARFLLLQVEPHWISFREAWRGGLAAAWQVAAEDPESLALVHLQDLDRALPELWLRPVLDLLSGLRDTLPPGEAWPPNLRLAASLAEGDAKLPLTPATTLCFTAPLGRGRDTEGADGVEKLPTSLPTGQPGGSWTAWQRALPEAREGLPIPRLAEVPMDFRRLVWEEVQRLAVTLSSLVDRPIEELMQMAFELRVASRQAGQVADGP